MKFRSNRQRLSIKVSAVLMAGAALLFYASPQADLVTRPSATLSLVNDNITAVVDEVSDLAVLANDTISNAGNFTLSVPAGSSQGGRLEVVGNTVRYTPPGSLTEGDTDSFEYTVTEEDFSTTSNGSFSVLSADNSGFASTMTDPGNGGVYEVTDAPGFANVSWDGVEFSSADINGNIDTSSLYRHIIEPDLSTDIEGCSTGSDPQIDITIRWNLTKTSGSAAGYEASIAWGSTFPLGNDFPGAGTAFVSELNWPAGETRELELTLEDLTATELNSLQLGLWAQDAQTQDPLDQNDWQSNSVTMSYSLDTTGCQIASASATVTITLGPPPDTDQDSILDRDDLDDDNDGITDILEQVDAVDIDTDNDGIVDRLDLDSDNDGILDVQESGAQDLQSLDTDSNGRIDGVVGANGLADAVETGADSGQTGYNLLDTDGDSVLDFRDLDSDNDGIPDLTETGAPSFLDTDQDARLDGAVGRDGLADNAQIDVDNGGYDLDSNGIVDSMPDTDQDGLPDSRDLDSDDDGLSDIFEAGGTDDVPPGGDGVLDDFSDTDSNGLDDSVSAIPLTAADTDNDGFPDFQDTDSDNDGLSDKAEGGQDSDGNGIPDYLQANARIQTGLGGGGCVMRSQDSFDPILPMLLLISLGFVLRRRRAG